MTRGLVIIAIGVLATGCVTNVGGTDESGGSDPSGGGGGGNGGGGGGGNGNGGSPATSYSWIMGTYGDCSVPCGGGVQARSVACIASGGSTAPDSDCTGPKPDAQQACNELSCSSGTSCTPSFHFGNSSQFLSTSPPSGAGPLTVSFDMTAFSYFPWDEIDFGDGTTFPGDQLVFVNTSANDGNGNDESTNSCVVHTFIAPGTYNVGRAQSDGNSYAEVTVTVQ